MSGELGLDLEGGAVLRAVPDPPSPFGGIETLGEDALVGELQSMIDALSRVDTGDDDDVHFGADPTIVPFSDLSPLVELGPSDKVAIDLVAGGEGPWRVRGLSVQRRTDSRSGVAGFYVAGELELDEGLRAHLVAVDMVMRAADGSVLGTEDCFAGYDVRRRCELEAEALMSGARAREVATIEIGVDAYIRHDVKLATGRPTGGTLVEPQQRYPLAATIRETGWPDSGWTACGELRNDSGFFLATVGLSLAVYDGDGEFLCDDEAEVTMLSPGDTRAFELIALMDDDDGPELAVLRGRFVTRSRQVTCTATLKR